MPWDRPETWDTQALAYHKQLIAMRNAHPALRTGAYRRLHADADTYAFARADGAEALLVAVNVADAPRSVAVPAGGTFADGAELSAIYGAGGTRVETGSMRIDLPARDGVVLLAK